MSGGSFYYLCSKDAGEILQYTYELSRMADELDDEFPGTQAAQDTRKLLQDIIAIQENVHQRIQALHDVWHAIEWWSSGDFGRDDAVKFVTQYKTQQLHPMMTWIPNG